MGTFIDPSQLSLPIGVGETTERDGLPLLAEAIQTLGANLELELARSAIAVARTKLADSGDPDVAETCVRAIAVILPAIPIRPYTAGLVEILKWPTTAGSATDALLEVLQERVPGAPAKEAGLDATVAWVAENFPEIDLGSPPTHPVPDCICDA